MDVLTRLPEYKTEGDYQDLILSNWLKIITDTNIAAIINWFQGLLAMKKTIEQTSAEQGDILHISG
jgi:hypothetical protein